MYRSDDDVLWPTDDQAIERNTLIGQCAMAIARLKPRPSDSFNGYIQQDPAVVAAVKKTILDIANVNCLLEHWYDGTVEGAAKVHPHGIAWRVLSETDGPISRAWFRMICLDAQCREWEQMYYAMNPSEGANICIG